MTSGSLWNYYKDEIYYVGDNFLSGKLFKYGKNIVEKTPERQKRPKRSLQPLPNPNGFQPQQPPQPLVPVLNA